MPARCNGEGRSAQRLAALLVAAPSLWGHLRPPSPRSRSACMLNLPPISVPLAAGRSQCPAHVGAAALTPLRALDVSTAVKQTLHVGRFPRMWKEKWVGPANLERANLRITAIDTYALVAAILLQVILGLYTASPEPAKDDPRIKYPRLQRVNFELQMLCLMVSVLCSTYTMVTFLLCKIYTVTALSVYKDVAFDLFTRATGPLRIKAFWSLIYSLVLFLAAFCLSLYTRVKGNRGLILCVVAGVVLVPLIQDWRLIFQLASKHIYS